MPENVPDSSFVVLRHEIELHLIQLMCYFGQVTRLEDISLNKIVECMLSAQHSLLSFVVYPIFWSVVVHFGCLSMRKYDVNNVFTVEFPIGTSVANLNFMERGRETKKVFER